VLPVSSTITPRKFSPMPVFHLRSDMPKIMFPFTYICGYRLGLAKLIRPIAMGVVRRAIVG